ncbi:uncharacterized protein LOC106163195 [Lingula anatina]|uniref:chitin synthase n=1 Tax=Lingula anatina TaxID=7574 RepID=A0A1S3IE78_LINAN|nr:uncharacterized protein LOC106163195 [Lingula anatina]|eukprot:XP_013396161.1 uncharacterized protein LOC106163195 [Lingula anatina]
MGIPKLGYISVLISMVASPLVVFIPLCSKETLAFIERYTPDQTLGGVIRRWLVGSLSPNCDPNNPEHLWAQVGLYIALLLSHLFLNRHVWNSLGKTAIPSLKWIFIQPLYCGILLEQSFMFRRRLPKDVDVDGNDVDAVEDVAHIPSCEDGSDVDSAEDVAHIPTGEDSGKKKPMVYACGTMWHESEIEMRQMLASIIRLDSAVKKEDSIFDYETHIMFDDAFTYTIENMKATKDASSRKDAPDPRSSTHGTKEEVKTQYKRRIVNNYVNSFFRITLEDVFRQDVDHEIVERVMKEISKATRSSDEEHSQTEPKTPATETNAGHKAAWEDRRSVSKSSCGTVQMQTSTSVHVNGNTHNPATCLKVTRTPYGGRLEIKMNNTTLYVHLKDKDKIRHRKRWSQVMYMYYLLQYNTNPKNPDKKHDENDLDNVYLLALDGDVDFHADALTSLVKEMASDKKLGAACGRIHPIGSGPMVWYQKFEYAIGHWLQKSAEHVLGCVLCSPGCFSLFRGKAVMEVIDIYSQRPKRAIDYLQFDQGEDRWLCTLLLQNGRSIKYCAASDAWTYAPETFSEFYNQRRRWSVSTIANLYDLISNGWETSTVNDNITFGFILYQALLLVSSLLGPATVLMAISTSITTLLIPNLSNDTAGSFVTNGIILLPIIFYIWVSFTQTKNVQLNVAAILSGIYALLMIATLVGIIVEVGTNIASMSSLIFLTLVALFVTTALLHPKELFCVLYGLFYFIAVPSMYVFLTIYSISNLNDVSWGTREIPKIVHDSEGGVPRKVTQGSEDEFNCDSFFGCICRCRKKDESQKQNEPPSQASPKQAKAEKDSGLLPQKAKKWTRVRELIFEEFTWTSAFSTHMWHKETKTTINLKEQNNYEYTFWKHLIKFRLEPIDKNADEETLKKDLKTLRNNSMTFVIFCNAVWIAFTILIQSQSDIFIRWHDHNGYEQKSDVLSLLFLSLFILVTIIQFICMLWHRFWTLILYISTAASSLKFGKNRVHPLNNSGDNAGSGTSENRSGDCETDSVDNNVGVENGRAIPPSAGDSETRQAFDEASPSFCNTSDKKDASLLDSPLHAETSHSGATHPTYGTNLIKSLQPKDPNNTASELAANDKLAPQTSQNVSDPVKPLPPLQVGHNTPPIKQQSDPQQTGIKHVNHVNELTEVEENILSSRDLAAYTSPEGSSTTMSGLPAHGKRMSPGTNQQSATNVLFFEEESGGAQPSGILKPDNIPQNSVPNNVDYSNQTNQVNAPDNLKDAGTADDTTSIESLSVPGVSVDTNSTVPLLDANDKASKNVTPNHPPPKTLFHNFDYAVQADAAQVNASYDVKDAGSAHPTHGTTLIEPLPQALPVELNNTASWSDANGKPALQHPEPLHAALSTQSESLTYEFASRNVVSAPPLQERCVTEGEEEFLISTGPTSDMPIDKHMHSWVSDTNIQEPTATHQNVGEQTIKKKRRRKKRKTIVNEQQNDCGPSYEQAPAEINNENNEFQLSDHTAPQTFN